MKMMISGATHIGGARLVDPFGQPRPADHEYAVPMTRVYETPWWNQIRQPTALVERAWRLPQRLMQQGWVEPTP